MKVKIAILTLAFAGLAFTASAQTTARTVNKKQKVQKARVAHGVANGTLTRREAKVLKVQQRHIRKVEKRAKADGTITPRERAILNKKQARASRNIKVLKNN